jgi:hypothetical protein
MGFLLLLLGVWRLTVIDYSGILFLFSGLILVLFHYGVQFDPDQKRYRHYKGIFSFIRGKWIDMNDVANLQIERIIQSQNMFVGPIGRTETEEVSRLIFNYPDGEYMQVASGEEDKILKLAKKISMAYNLDIINESRD